MARPKIIETTCRCHGEDAWKVHPGYPSPDQVNALVASGYKVKDPKKDK